MEEVDIRLSAHVPPILQTIVQHFLKSLLAGRVHRWAEVGQAARALLGVWWVGVVVVVVMVVVVFLCFFEAEVGAVLQYMRVVRGRRNNKKSVGM